MDYLKSAVVGVAMIPFGVALCVTRVSWRQCGVLNSITKEIALFTALKAAGVVVGTQQFTLNEKGKQVSYTIDTYLQKLNNAQEKQKILGDWGLKNSILDNTMFSIFSSLFGAAFHDHIGRDLGEKFAVNPYFLDGVATGCLGAFVYYLHFARHPEFAMAKFFGESSASIVVANYITQGFFCGVVGAVGAYFGDKNCDNDDDVMNYDDSDLLSYFSNILSR